MRRGFSLIAMTAVLAQVPASVAPLHAAPPQERRSNGEGLCRKPDALPVLGAEQVRQQQNQREERRSVGAVPPPPPMAPDVRGSSAAMAEADGGSEDVIVTASRIPSPSMDSPVAVTTISSEELTTSSTDKATSAEAGEAAAVAPPPPPPPPVVVATGSAEARVMPGYPIPPRPYPPRPPRPQSGLLTAGEHDDLLNPELYADYVRKSDLAQQVPDLPRLDTARVLTVTVKDRAGRPVPFATVELACADGSRLMLKTMADGSVAFFPNMDRLGKKVWVRAASADWREVGIANGQGGQRIDFTISQQAQAVRKLDLVLAIDTTGSMGDEIRYLQSELQTIVGAIRQRHPGLDLRVGFVFYRDLGDDYVTSTFPLSADVAAGQRELSRHSANGGGDYPEAMDQALIRAAGQAWRPDAVKTMLLVADAPPHDENFGLTWRAAEHLRAKRVHIVPVAASGVADKAEYAMRAMAAATQSRYTFLTDDSGVGNPHAAPAIDCYLVTRLETLLRRVIDSQLSGRRIEPGEQEVIRSVGQSDNGRCVIPPAMRFQ